eukprot:CAMPEP_0177607820 /NCGR_PEP_ID=MMETSP0419_2-20121207/18128_1 /TAXON_ID=582737 /ORGANISM="Tetraselmis sp., Strain GSL018" /LENGTH=162 /DNA_ID=CAMNT_0019102441 /DNA_START=821 /DNA_END=1311 /DNA_ORIENTATION=+
MVAGLSMIGHRPYIVLNAMSAFGPCGGGYTARWQLSDELMQAILADANGCRHEAGERGRGGARRQPPLSFTFADGLERNERVREVLDKAKEHGAASTSNALQLGYLAALLSLGCSEGSLLLEQSGAEQAAAPILDAQPINSRAAAARRMRLSQCRSFSSPVL